MTTDPVIRRARAADVPALVDLRAQMMRDMGADTGDDSWRVDAAAWYRARLAEPTRCAAIIAEVPGDGVVACAVGTVDDHAPSPRNPSGLRGEIANVVTFPAFRRRGLARTCVEALLQWFDAEMAVRVVRLAATADGEALYRRLGFREPRDLILERRMAR